MSTPKCLEFESRLQSAIEHREPLFPGQAADAPRLRPGRNGAEAADADWLRQHASECDACQRLWQTQVVVDQAIAEWRTQVPDVDLVARILARHRDENRAATRSPVAESHASNRMEVPGRVAQAAAPTVTVASVADVPAARLRRSAQNTIVALVAGSFLSAMVVWMLSEPAEDKHGAHFAGRQAIPGRRAEPQEATQPSVTVGEYRPALDVEGPAEAELPVMAETPRVEVSELVREMGTAYLSLAGNAAASMRGAASLVPAEGLSLLKPSAAGAHAGSEDSGDKPPEAGSGGAGPWGRNIGRALDFLLWDSMSSDDAPAT